MNSEIVVATTVFGAALMGGLLWRNRRTDLVASISATENEEDFAVDAENEVVPQVTANTMPAPTLAPNEKVRYQSGSGAWLIAKIVVVKDGDAILRRPGHAAEFVRSTSELRPRDFVGN